MYSSQLILCMTFSFYLYQVFSDVLLHKNYTLRYSVFYKTSKPMSRIRSI